jgi:integrase
MLLHGLRLSEMRGLTWDNIDLKNGVMTVKGALVRGPDGEVAKKQNKNATSTRPVPIMIPRLLELLKAADGKAGPVVVIGAGTMLDDVKRACKRAGVTEVTCHGLRHSFASLCYYLEIPERQIQEWGGWKDRATLHRIYIRLTAAGQSEAQTKFTSFFGK